MTTLNLDYETGAAYYGDCADIMTAWKSKGVQGIIDLIYLDPPFNSNRNYGAPTSKSKKNDTGSMDAFVDMWTYDQPARDRVDRICNQQKLHPARLLIKSLKPYLEVNDDGMLAYLSYMADRLRLFHGLLRDTGSIYLHCDPYANYYLRLLMDSIFGAKNFRNEIVWSYRTGGVSKRWFGRKHDTILCYGKSRQDLKTQADPKSKTKFNPMKEKSYLTHKYGFSTIKIEEDEGGYYRMAQIRDVWDIPALRGNHSEWEGYPTQKPLALLDRIIQASTNKGDLVLDPFAGCGTAMHSAVNNKRRFIGIDISVFTIHEVCRKRLQRKCGVAVPVFGIPTNFDGAKLLAKQDKFKFEAWAAETLTYGNIGIISNKIKRNDKGIDGSGLLYGYNEYGEDKVIVQVKGGGFNAGDVREFRGVIDANPEVAAGIFITLDGDNHKAPNGFRWTRGMEREALIAALSKCRESTNPFAACSTGRCETGFKARTASIHECRP